ncbi:MAG TPA: Flp pilus assembly protein CpaB [Accumulibacter sp.]|nr:Flp pilus assembly protein CpaB [Accumulibacter sp.]
MKSSRIVVAGIAGVAAIGALLLTGTSSPPPAPIPVQPTVSSPTPVETFRTTDVLVALGDLAMGSVLQDSDLKWMAFPADGVTPQYINKNDSPEAIKELAGAIARQPFLAGEPIRREKLIRGKDSGFLAAVLPAGKRAVAINTDATGANSAGGFILPNDFVDVIRVYRDEENSKAKGIEVYKSESVLTNVRVLAIGQNVQERNGERYITGQTATLELDPLQTEQVMLAQKVGSLSLALRSLQDAAKNDEVRQPQRRDTGLTVVRFGVSHEAVTK